MTFLQASNYCFLCYDHRFREKARWYNPDECSRCRNHHEHVSTYCPCGYGFCEIKNQEPRPDLDYIETVERTSPEGVVVHKRWDIDVPIKFLQEMARTYQRNGTTMLDLQQVLDTNYPKILGSEVNFCSPHSYQERFVDKFVMPRFVLSEKYAEWVDARRRGYVAEYDNVYANRPKSANYELNKGKYVKDKLMHWHKNLKRQYYALAMRAVAQHHFRNVLKDIYSRLGDRLLAYSSGAIGKTTRNYPVSETVRLSFCSNFGYGTSSAFWIVLYYKNVAIVPFSYYVNYYFAKASDLCRYTRAYFPQCESWSRAFDFLEEVLNQEKTDDKTFIEKWIVKEVDKMMEGMEKIMTDPESFFSEWAEKSSPGNKHVYRFVRSLNGKERSLYACYPNEMRLDFQAEKISGAYDLLAALEKLEGFYAGIRQHIDRIYQMASQFYPRVLQGIAILEQDLKRLDGEVLKKQSDVSRVKESLEHEKKRIHQLCGAAMSNTENESEQTRKWSAKYSELTVEGSKFDILTKRLSDEENTFEELVADRDCRRNFRKRLEEFKRALKAKRGHEILDPLDLKKRKVHGPCPIAVM